MAGSGTTLAVAKALGHTPLGFDTDPLAVLLAQTWCSDVREDDVLAAAKRVETRARRVARSMRVRDAYPFGADENTRAFVRYWFDEVNRRQLSALAGAIADVRRADTRGVLWCALSRTIIAKQASVSRALDVPHSRPHRVDGRPPVRAFDVFLPAVRKVLQAAPFTKPTGIDATVRRGDARALPIRENSIDVVITSPPYLNAIDYLRGHRFSLVWMGHQVDHLRQVRRSNIGTEAALAASPALPIVARTMAAMGGTTRLAPRQRALLARYILDMERALTEIRRVLVPGGRALLVVGDCSIRGVFVRNSKGLAFLAEHAGLTVASITRRKLPANKRYLPPPSADGSGELLGNRMRSEALLRLEKRAA